MNMQQSFRDLMLQTGHISGGNLDYVEGLYESWLHDPATVSDEWQAYFASLPQVAGGNGADVSHEDIISQFRGLPRRGSGTVQVAAPYNASHEVKQVSVVQLIASYRVRGAILDHLRMLDPMSRKLRGASRRITQVASDLVGRLGRAPEQEEIAAELGMPLADYHKLLTEISEAGYARLELNDFGEPSSLESSPEAVATRRQLVGTVANAIDGLPERLNLIVGLYYQEECSFREIGEVLGVTESRVCQLHSEAMHLIRAMVEGRPISRRRRGGSAANRRNGVSA